LVLLHCAFRKGEQSNYSGIVRRRSGWPFVEVRWPDEVYASGDDPTASVRLAKLDIESDVEMKLPICPMISRVTHFWNGSNTS
jgi:hypothetical protein